MDEFAEQVEHAVEAVLTREEEALEDTQDSVTNARSTLDTLRAKNAAAHLGDDAVSRAIAEADVAMKAILDKKRVLAVSAVHPMLRTRGRSSRQLLHSSSSTSLNRSPRANDKHNQAEEQTWVAAANEALDVVTLGAAAVEAVERARLAMQQRDQADSRAVGEVDDARARLLAARELLAALEATNAAAGSPADEATVALGKASAAVVAATTTENLYLAASHTKVLREQLIASVPIAEEALKAAADLIAARDAAARSARSAALMADIEAQGTRLEEISVVSATIAATHTLSLSP